MLTRAPVPLFFGQDALAASQSAVALTVPMAEASQVISGVPMMWDYDILGIEVKLSAGATAGSATFVPTIDGTAVAVDGVVLTTQTQKSAKILRNRRRGRAGSAVGVKVTTTAGWDAITADAFVVLWVLPRVFGV